jgi:hypothetical protein
MAILHPYHAALRELLAQQPGKGRGHPWLFRVALHLRHYHTEEACFRLLRACADEWKDRAVPDAEIRKAVRKAYSATPEENRETASVRWPDPDPEAIARVLAATAPVFALNPLDIPAQRLLPCLFDFDELVCAGYSQQDGCTDTLRDILVNADKYQYVVPSPMTARTGANQEGLITPRCLANTGPRRLLVIENDVAVKEDQARILSHLARFVPLVLVVDSAGKSLHGWYAVAHLPEFHVRLVMEYAVHLGADPHTWVRCQWVRMPGGTRYNPDAAPRRQEILYVHPEILPEVCA